MMKQFYDLKAKHPTAILLFRCGDFYETYEQDACICANVLGITLTKSTETGVQMAGFPCHALDTYLPKLVRYCNQPESIMKRVAICDQLEDPKLTKKLVRRGSDELTTTATNNRTNNPQTTESNMKLNLSNSKNESANVQNAQVNNQSLTHSPSPVGDGSVAPIKVAQDIVDADFEEVTDNVPQKEQKEQKAAPKKVTLKRKVTLKKKSEPISEEVKEEISAVSAISAGNNLPRVTFSTYKTKKGDTAPQIIGFSGEDDPRYKAVKESGAKWVSAGWKKDLQGNKVYILLFGTRYMDVAKALAGAYNTKDVNAWHRAEDACMAIYEQAQRDAKSRWEAKKAAWAEKKAEKAAQKAADEQAKRCYTKEDVAAMLADVLAGKDVPEEIKALLKAA